MPAKEVFRQVRSDIQGKIRAQDQTLQLKEDDIVVSF
jgi:hypothetical protein